MQTFLEFKENLKKDDILEETNLSAYDEFNNELVFIDDDHDIFNYISPISEEVEEIHEDYDVPFLLEDNDPYKYGVYVFDENKTHLLKFGQKARIEHVLKNKKVASIPKSKNKVKFNLNYNDLREDRLRRKNKYITIANLPHGETPEENERLFHNFQARAEGETDGKKRQELLSVASKYLRKKVTQKAKDKEMAQKKKQPKKNKD